MTNLTGSARIGNGLAIHANASRQLQGLPATQIEMSPEMQRSLDDQGKLDRNPKATGQLIAHGEERAKHFLVARDRMVKAKR